MLLDLIQDYPPPNFTSAYGAHRSHTPGAWSSMMPDCYVDDVCSALEDCCSTVLPPPVEISVEIMTLGSQTTTVTLTHTDTDTPTTRVPPTTITDRSKTGHTTSMNPSASSTFAASIPITNNANTPQTTAASTPSSSTSLPSTSDPTTHILNQAALAGIVIGTAAAAIILTLFILFLLRRRRRRGAHNSQCSPDQPASLKHADDPTTAAEQYHQHHHSSLPTSTSSWLSGKFHNRTSSSTTSRTLVNSSPSVSTSSPAPWHTTDSSQQRGSVTQWLPAIHELPAYHEHEREREGLWAGFTNAYPEENLDMGSNELASNEIREDGSTDVGHGTEVESEVEPEIAEFGKARVVRIGGGGKREFDY